MSSPCRSTRPPTSLVLLVCAALPACGIGYGQKAQSMKIGPNGSAFAGTAPSDLGTTSMSMRTNTITLYDKSGILLAGIGSAGSKYTAEQKAKQEAVDRGAKEGDTVEYEYQTYAPVPGKMTTLSYSWGDSDGVDSTVGDVPMGAVSYHEIDLTAGMHTWDLGTSALSISLGANFQKWSISSASQSGYDFDVSRTSMPIGLSYAYEVIPRVQASARATWDWLAVFSYGEKHHLDYTLGVHTSVVLLSWLHLEVDAAKARYPLEFGKRDGNQLEANASLVLWWSGPSYMQGIFGGR